MKAAQCSMISTLFEAKFGRVPERLRHKIERAAGRIRGQDCLGNSPQGLGNLTTIENKFPMASRKAPSLRRSSMSWMQRPSQSALSMASTSPTLWSILIIKGAQDVARDHGPARRPVVRTRNYPVTCSSVSGAASSSTSNHSSLKAIRFLCFIARLDVRAMIASAMATTPLHRGPPSSGDSGLPSTQ